MLCWTVERRLTAFLENSVPENEGQQLRSHLRRCSACAARAETQRQMRALVHALPRHTAPADLFVRLQVLASKERAADRRPGSLWRKYHTELKLAVENLMKPIALPAAGGLCAAI